AQSRIKLLAKLEPVAAVITEEVRAIEIAPPAKPLAPPIIALDDVAVGYEPGRPVLRRLTLRIDDDDRIALLGANGNGKSTLVKLLSERLAPMSGRVTRADRLDIAYFAQHQLDELNPDASSYDHLRALMPDAPEAKIRARAGAIGFPEGAADTPTGALSGGEKSRLLLGLATLSGPHLVILDEPTNHLDIDSRAALITAINDYPGAVIPRRCGSSLRPCVGASRTRRPRSAASTRKSRGLMRCSPRPACLPANRQRRPRSRRLARTRWARSGAPRTIGWRPAPHSKPP